MAPCQSPGSPKGQLSPASPASPKGRGQKSAAGKELLPASPASPKGRGPKSAAGKVAQPDNPAAAARRASKLLAKLSPDLAAALRGLFEAYDANGSGKIDIEEFVEAEQAIASAKGCEFDVDGAVQAFLSLDVDLSGGASLAEFAFWKLRRLGTLSNDRAAVSDFCHSRDVIHKHRATVQAGTVDMLKVFKKWDSSGDGFMYRSDLERVLFAVGVPRSKLPGLFESIDQNGDGKISYEEFCRWIAPCGPAPNTARTALELALHPDDARMFRPDAAFVSPSSFALASEEDRAKLPTPNIEPAGGIFVGGVRVRISCSLDDSELFYTVDGSSPLRDGIPYLGPFEWTQSGMTVIRCVARSSIGHSASAWARVVVCHYVLPKAIVTAQVFLHGSRRSDACPGGAKAERKLLGCVEAAVARKNCNVRLTQVCDVSTTLPVDSSTNTKWLRLRCAFSRCWLGILQLKMQRAPSDVLAFCARLEAGLMLVLQGTFVEVLKYDAPTMQARLLLRALDAGSGGPDLAQRLQEQLVDESSQLHTGDLAEFLGEAALEITDERRWGTAGGPAERLLAKALAGQCFTDALTRRLQGYSIPYAAVLEGTVKGDGQHRVLADLTLHTQASMPPERLRLVEQEVLAALLDVEPAADDTASRDSSTGSLRLCVAEQESIAVESRVSTSFRIEIPPRLALEDTPAEQEARELAVVIADPAWIHTLATEMRQAKLGTAAKALRPGPDPEATELGTVHVELSWKVPGSAFLDGACLAYAGSTLLHVVDYRKGALGHYDDGMGQCFQTDKLEEDESVEEEDFSPGSPMSPLSPYQLSCLGTDIDAFCDEHNGAPVVPSQVREGWFELCEAIKHCGSTTHEFMNSHLFAIHFESLPDEVTDLFFVLAAHGQQDLSQFSGLRASIQDSEMRQLTEYNIAKRCNYQAIVVCSLSRRSGFWTVQPVDLGCGGSILDYDPIKARISLQQARHQRWIARGWLLKMYVLWMKERMKLSEERDNESLARLMQLCWGVGPTLFRLVLRYLGPDVGSLERRAERVVVEDKAF